MDILDRVCLPGRAGLSGLSLRANAARLPDANIVMGRFVLLILLILLILLARWTGNAYFDARSLARIGDEVEAPAEHGDALAHANDAESAPPLWRYDEIHSLYLFDFDVESDRGFQGDRGQKSEVRSQK